MRRRGPGSGEFEIKLPKKVDEKRLFVDPEEVILRRGESFNAYRSRVLELIPDTEECKAHRSFLEAFITVMDIAESGWQLRFMERFEIDGDPSEKPSLYFESEHDEVGVYKLRNEKANELIIACNVAVAELREFARDSARKNLISDNFGKMMRGNISVRDAVKLDLIKRFSKDGGKAFVDKQIEKYIKLMVESGKDTIGSLIREFESFSENAREPKDYTEPNDYIDELKMGLIYLFRFSIKDANNLIGSLKLASLFSLPEDIRDKMRKIGRK